MTTTGTTAFNLDLNDLVEEAFERAGSELRSGYDFRTARRSLNLLTIEWANRGINLWTIEQAQIQLITGQVTYALPIDTIDLLDQVVRTNSGSVSNQTDINISRISESTYSTIPNKLTQGRPIQVWINRQSDATTPTGVSAPTINVWPAPSAPDNQYVFVYWRLRRIQDVGDGANTQDIPFRFLPAMVAGLAYYLSIKIQGTDPQRVMGLKADYEEQFKLASEEDREKAPIRFVPRNMSYTR
jgi:hypothetical protein